ncbi:hypothetical protein N431DRAFT_302583, partial [Stipitochalara longipes BDJ]
IYSGPWVNHSHGDVLGATITLMTRDAAFLLALLAIIVTTAGHSLWTIISYILHQTRSKPGQHDARFYQEQAILKNSGNALDAAWKFSRTSFAWRKHAKSKTYRPLSFIVIAVVLATLFAVASIFSSQVTKAAGSEFLLNSDDCGFWTFDINASAADEFKYNVKSLNTTVEAANYASNCYGTSNTNTAQCDTYIIPEITWTTNQNSSCPFASGTCLLSPTAAYEMDTGLLDSHDHLGINARGSERIAVRKVATCAPVHVTPYVVIFNETFGDGNVDTLANVQLGDIGDGTGTTWTYDLHLQFMNIGYELQSISTHDTSSSASGIHLTWNPIAEFNRTDADITMFFFAANFVLNTYPNSDPIFSANRALNTNKTLDGKEIVIYTADLAVTTIGCIDQYQICNPNLSGLAGEPVLCTPLGPAYSLFAEAERIDLNLYQLATLETIDLAFRYSSMFNSVNGRGSSALQAQNTVLTLIQSYQQQAQLPNNQWQIELSSWFAVSLATVQQYLVEKASGPIDVLEAGGSITKPSNKYEEAICKRQMIRNVAGYQNFSTLGVAIILVFGSGLIVLGLVIDTVAGRIQKQFLKRDYQRLSWVSDGYLQLQRLAYEGAGYDEWDGFADEVPVSKDVEQQVPELGGLEDSDL